MLVPKHHGVTTDMEMVAEKALRDTSLVTWFERNFQIPHDLVRDGQGDWGLGMA